MVSLAQSDLALRLAYMVGFVLVTYALYVVSSKAIRVAVLGSHGRDEDAEMIQGFWRIVVLILAPMIMVAVFFPQYWVLPTFMGAFGGMFLGWALQPVITSLAVWVLITLNRPFKLGDRIHLPNLNVKGDVLEVSPMYTVLNQVGGSVGDKEAVGRNILIPNSVLFSHATVNFTPEAVSKPRRRRGRDSVYTLDEVVVRITYDTDWEEAERMLREAAREVTGDIIKAAKQEPYIRSDMYDYGVYLRLRYMTLSTERPRIKYEIEKRVFREFNASDRVDFAVPFVYSAKRGASGHAIQ
jgi:small-conductance mechanosensitive channel